MYSDVNTIRVTEQFWFMI